MGQDDPWLLAAMILAVGVVARWWWSDFRAAARGTPDPRAFPGATPATRRSVLVAIGGAGVLLILETAGEQALGLTAAQSRMTALFALSTLAAAFGEELVFRGYLVVQQRGRLALLAGTVAASLAFALIHPFLWQWEAGSLQFQSDRKAWFSTLWVFLGSLWFYAVRFMPLNPTRSLLPCFAAHLTKNLGVIGIKYAQGFLTGWW